jgi:hypothetical protein
MGVLIRMLSCNKGNKEMKITTNNEQEVEFRVGATFDKSNYFPLFSEY